MIIASDFKETVRERWFPMLLFILFITDFIVKEAAIAVLIKANKFGIKTMSHFFIDLL